MNTKAFVITLERATHRQEQVRKILADCPWRCEISPAVDGSLLPASEIDASYQRNLHRPRYPHPLRWGEIGCFLSHRRLWQRMVDESLDMALILEDDVDLQLPAFAATLEFASEKIEPGDYLQFQVRDIGPGHAVCHASEAGSIVQPRIAPLRTSAQLVTLEAARKLLAASRPFDRPVDTFLQMSWVTGVPMKVVVPSHVIEISQQIGGSTIGSGRKPWLTRLRREALRPWYRSQVALWSLLTSGSASSRRRAG